MLENNNGVFFMFRLQTIFELLYIPNFCVCEHLFLQLQKPVERQVMCVSYSFLHGFFLSKFTSLKKPQKEGTVRIQTEYKLQIQDLQAPEQKGRRGKFIVTSPVK